MSSNVYVIIFFLVLIFARGFIVIFHELGHAFAGMMLYKGNFNVFIGSYGDTTNGWRIKIGRLRMHFIYNPIAWDRGLCVPDEQTHSYKRRFLFILGGPLGSLLLSLFLLSLILTHMDEILKVYVFLTAVYAFSDFVMNLIPKNRQIMLFNGGITYNDGQLMKTILKQKNSLPALAKLTEIYEKHEFEKTIEFYESLEKTEVLPITSRIAAHAYLMLKNYDACIKTYENVDEGDQFTADDYCNFGLAKSFTNKHTEAFEQYNKALQQNPDHKYALNNRGYTYNLLAEYEKALLDFNKIIQQDAEFAHAYNNRGLSKIKLGFADDGLTHIERSLELDNTNSYAYLNKGIYYLDKKNYRTAYELFLKAKELDSYTHLIDDYLEETKLLIEGKI
jgi:hypothetical protein